MQNLQISDQAAQQLDNMAALEHITRSDLIERLIAQHAQELMRRQELKVFFNEYKKDMSSFRFDREEANVR